MPGAGVRLRDVRVAARHADRKTTVRYDRARDPDQHLSYIPVAHTARGT